MAVYRLTDYTRQIISALPGDDPNDYPELHPGDVVTHITSGEQYIWDGSQFQGPLPTGGAAPVLVAKTITENGTYAASADNADGYSSVTVNVSGSSGDPNAVARSILNGTITSYEDDTITSLRNYAFYKQNLLRSVKCHNVTSVANYAFEGSKVGALAFLDQVFIRTGSSPAYNAPFANAKHLEILDLACINGAGIIPSQAFVDASLFTTLIIRQNFVLPLDSENAFQGTGFESGGTIYIPQSMYDHLEDGTSYDYLSNTEWAAFNDNYSPEWLPIEGSEWEDQYGDGTPIPTT